MRLKIKILNNMGRSVEDLDIYKKAVRLEIYVHQVTKHFPEEEKYRSVDQLNRSSSSVCNNIVEGYNRFSYQDKIKHFYIARAEAEETRLNIKRSSEKGFVPQKVVEITDKNYLEVIKGINGYINFLKNKKDKS